MPFSFQTARWPSSFIINQATSFGTTRPVAHVRDELRTSDVGRECDYCLARTLTSWVIRDQFSVRIWHLDCFLLELASRKATGEWVLVQMEWRVA